MNPYNKLLRAIVANIFILTGFSLIFYIYKNAFSTSVFFVLYKCNLYFYTQIQSYALFIQDRAFW